MYDFSVVIPVFNSEFALEQLFQDLTTVFTSLQKKAQYIFVDDGSSDKSWEELKKLKEQGSENVIIVRLSKNYGQSNATFCGLELAEGEYVITIDDD